MKVIAANNVMLAQLRTEITALPAPYPRYVVFVSSSDGNKRARVVTVTASDLDNLARKLTHPALQQHFNAKYLRFDWVTAARPMRFGDYTTALRAVKRNYSRKGLSCDPAFRHAITEAEINANALLYKGSAVAHCEFNPGNFQIYWERRFGKAFQAPDADHMVHLFTTKALFRDRSAPELVKLEPPGANAGRRFCDLNDKAQLDRVIRDGANYLAGEVNSDGSFRYGWHPCFDRPIRHYNTLRHASSTYALCEAYEHLRSPHLLAAIKRSLRHLASGRIISPLGPEGPAYLVDLGNEIKLGGNAVAILAYCKYGAATGDTRYLSLARRLGQGILSMQATDGSYAHVLHADSLQVKDRQRTVYYDGEAAFALMRLYHATADPVWLNAVRAAVRRYIAADYWQYNDHWLAYCTTELALTDPDPEYFRFGIRNVRDYIPFIAGRITTFPTLLELCCATRLLVRQALSDPALRPTLQGLDLPAFVKAMETRAQYLANGVFFPEVAIYFRNPARITGSFFIRHHGFRVRIDDVEHYLSGLIAYRAYLDDRADFHDLMSRHGNVAAQNI